MAREVDYSSTAEEGHLSEEMSLRRPTKNFRLFSFFYLRTHVILLGIFFMLVMVVMFLYWPNQAIVFGDCPFHRFYNGTYPLTRPLTLADGRSKFRIAIVTDMDQDSRLSAAPKWWSKLRKGWLYFKMGETAEIEWDRAKPVELSSKVSAGNRGMELSDLVIFDGKLLTVDDRTGIVYEIFGNRVIPWLILPDGDGRQSKGFKAEWMAVKDTNLFIGGLGKEWVTNGVVMNRFPQWVKVVAPSGHVTHTDWSQQYNAMREAMDARYPGYAVHESAQWSSIHQRWFFLPRRVSKEPYNEKDDEKRGTNMMIQCTADFTSIQISRIGDINPTHGFSAFRFIPGTNDRAIVALKTVEDNGNITTFVMIFDIDGNMLLRETIIEGAVKYEGIEFI